MIEFVARLSGRVIPQAQLLSFLLAAAVATIAMPQEASATPSTIKICKQTVPSVSTPLFNFVETGSGGGPAFQLPSGSCQTLSAGFHKVTETPVPPGWALTNITCSFVTSVVRIIGANANPAFQPGDDTVYIDSNEPNVVCTFINSPIVGKLTKFSVTKTVDPGWALVPPGLTFPVQVNCTPSGPNPVLNLTSSLPSQTIPVAAGSNCTVTELAPLGTIPAYCHWGTVTYPLGQSIGITAPQTNLEVHNRYLCDQSKSHDVGINKTAGTVAANGSVTFTLHVFNVGPGPVGAGQVTVTDTLPAGFSPISANGMGPDWNCTVSGQTITCNYTGMSVGANQSLSSIVVQTTAHSAGSFQNCAHVQYNNGIDVAPGNNNSCVSITVKLSHDVGINKTGGGNVLAGTSLSFVLHVFNIGPGPVGAGQVTVTDTLPAGFSPISANGMGPDWNCTVSGQTITCNYTGMSVGANQSLSSIVVQTTAHSAGNFQNCAHVQYNNGIDIAPGNNNSCVPVAVTQPTYIDIGISKNCTCTTTVGGTVHFFLSVFNYGTPVGGGTVRVTDTLPAGLTPTAVSAGPNWSCTISGQTVTCDYIGVDIYQSQPFPTIDVSATAHSVGNFTNYTHAQCTACIDSNLANNDDHVSIAVTGHKNPNGSPASSRYDFGISKSGPGSWPAGSAGIFHLVVTNNGAATAPPVTIAVNDNLPAGLTFVAAAGSGWTCGPSAPVSCTYSGAVAAGQTLPPISVTAIAGKPGGVENCATVALNGATDKVSGNNRSCVSIKIGKPKRGNDNSVNPIFGPDQNGGEVEPVNPATGGPLPTTQSPPSEPPPLYPPPQKHRKPPHEPSPVQGKGNDDNSDAAPHP